MSKLEINPLRYPSPLTYQYVAGQQRILKHLGVSASVDNGICYWRVQWRPTLPRAIARKDSKGRLRVKRKADNVRTERFPIVNGAIDGEVFDLAVIRACEVYRLPMKPGERPNVDWEMFARATGQKIRNKFAKPVLNEGTIDEAAEMFEAGASNSMVAKRFGVDRSTASRWRKKARQMGT